ncbi:MAG TPA: DEAD/DEAH box helicase, partial [Flavobacteriales bacterium]|nr:DEAD/DEAH box helicase [Flavobacteriales bacterium]
MPAYIDVILPLAVPGVFTYAWPDALPPVQPGMRVSVPFGRGRKLYGGVVKRVHQEAPPYRTVRPALGALDNAPVVNTIQIDLWDRMAEHYLCSLGEVMIAALPAQLALSSETRLVANPDHVQDPVVRRRAGVLLDALEHRNVVTLEEAGELLGLKDPMPVVKTLMDQGALQLEEELKDTWKPRMVTYVRLAPGQGEEAVLHGWFDRLEKAPKQLHLLMRYIELSRCLSSDPREVERNALLRAAGATGPVLKGLLDKGLFATYEREAGVPADDAASKPPPVLSPAQTEAIRSVKAGFAEKDVVLLRGVTSSGKTELYITLIQEMVDSGRQVLYLLPEIALTTQIIARLRERFGDRIAVSHSRMAQHERTALWLRMAQGDAPPPIVVGARSALFLPFRDLGLIVVDEEHDPSYKQHDPAPRYHARDMAIVLAGLHHAKT